MKTLKIMYFLRSFFVCVLRRYFILKVVIIIKKIIWVSGKEIKMLPKSGVPKPWSGDRCQPVGHLVLDHSGTQCKKCTSVSVIYFINKKPSYPLMSQCFKDSDTNRITSKRFFYLHIYFILEIE